MKDVFNMSRRQLLLSRPALAMAPRAFTHTSGGTAVYVSGIFRTLFS